MLKSLPNDHPMPRSSLYFGNRECLHPHLRSAARCSCSSGVVGAPQLPDACTMLVFVFRMFSDLMQCLLSWRFERLTTVSPASAFAEERGLCLLNKRDPKRFDSDGRGASSSSTVPLRFRSHETLAASRIALISFFNRLFMAAEMFKSVMAGMILLSRCASDESSR